MEEAWGEIQSYLLEVFDWAGVEGIEAEELAVVPGLDEVFGLGDIKTYADSGEWDVIVVDCAPTAETIRLLSLPDILGWYMDRVFPIEPPAEQGRVARCCRGSRTCRSPATRCSASARRFYDRLDGVRELLTDAERTSVRLVVNPERMVIAEARRTYTYLSLFGYRVDAVIANRLLPDDDHRPVVRRSGRSCRPSTSRRSRRASPRCPSCGPSSRPTSWSGSTGCASFAAALYGDLDPTAVLHQGAPLEVRKRGDTAELIIDLPFADRDDLELGRRHDELLVRVGAVPPGAAAARLAAQADGHRRRRCATDGCGSRSRRTRRGCVHRPTACRARDRPDEHRPVRRDAEAQAPASDDAIERGIEALQAAAAEAIAAAAGGARRGRGAGDRPAHGGGGLEPPRVGGAARRPRGRPTTTTAGRTGCSASRSRDGANGATDPAGHRRRTRSSTSTRA